MCYRLKKPFTIFFNKLGTEVYFYTLQSVGACKFFDFLERKHPLFNYECIANLK